MMHTDTNEENLGAFIKLLDVALQHKVCIGRHIRNGLGQLGQWISLLQMPALGGVHSAGDQAQSIDSIRNFNLVKLPCFCRCSLWSRESCSLTGNNSAIKLLECFPQGRLTEEADSKWRQTSVYYCQGLVYFLLWRHQISVCTVNGCQGWLTFLWRSVSNPCSFTIKLLLTVDVLSLCGVCNSSHKGMWWMRS